MVKQKLGWLATAQRWIEGGFLILCALALWFFTTPVYAVARLLDWLDEIVDRAFKKRFGGW